MRTPLTRFRPIGNPTRRVHDNHGACRILGPRRRLLRFAALSDDASRAVGPEFDMAKLVFGCGYLGSRVVERWIAAGEKVHVVTRRPERAAELAAIGCLPIVGDITIPGSMPAFPPVDTLLFAVGFDRRSGQSIHTVYVDGLRTVLQLLEAASAPLPRRVIYISSTGVYGTAGGDWVDETTECHPQRDGGRACLDAERLLHADPWRDRTVILRCAGIYGPGRIPHRQQLLDGQPLAVPSHGFLNLIHVDDAAVVTANLGHSNDFPPTEPPVGPPSPLVLNLSDGHPVVRSEYYAEVARLLGAPPPRFVEPSGDSPATLRAGADKRVSNERAVRLLRPTWLYPSYREGLAAILAAR